MIKYKTVADIGSGHALLPIYLVENGICGYAVATELNLGPLEITAEAVKSAGFEDIISVKYGNGLEPVVAGECECCVISGMGGLTIEKIISLDPEKTESFSQLVLQPQGNADIVRKAIHALEFDIIEESIIFEDEKYYIIISAERRAGKNFRPYSEAEYLIGRKLIEKGGPVLKAYLLEEFRILYATLGKFLPEIFARKSQAMQQAENELLKERDLYAAVLECIERSEML